MATEGTIDVRLKENSVTALSRTDNKISFEITNTTAARLEDLTAVLAIPYGETESADYPISNNTEAMKIETAPSKEVGERGDFDPEAKGKILWATSSLGFDLDKGETLTITVSGFAALTEGTATIELKIEQEEGKKLNEKSSFLVNVKAATGKA